MVKTENNKEVEDMTKQEELEFFVKNFDKECEFSDDAEHWDRGVLQGYNAGTNWKWKNERIAYGYVRQIKEPTTVIEWLEKIPCPKTRASAIEQCRENMKYEKCSSLGNAIGSFTVWTTTKEGLDYWAKCKNASTVECDWPKCPDKKTVPWEREDYKLTPWLRHKSTGRDYAVTCYSNEGLFTEKNFYTYKQVSKLFTLSDDTPLTKEV